MEKIDAPKGLNPSRIFINPKFKKAYINPNFIPPKPLVPKPSNIHLNPKFLEVLRQQNAIEEKALKRKVAPIIKNTKRKLIRLPSSPSKVPSTLLKPPSMAPMIKIGKNKLIRSTTSVRNQAIAIAAAIPPKAFRPLVSKKYKLVNSNTSIRKRKTSIRKYSLIRSEPVTPKKFAKQLNMNNLTTPNASINKKLTMININGVLYKSSKNKLQKTSPTIANGATNPTKDRVLIVRGVKFSLDASGSKLQRLDNDKRNIPTKMKRLDIGGLTYKANKDGTYMRTDSHWTRSYLSIAKQKSINVLSSKMTKCNVPCPIYRRIGKCLALSRGKCPKVHDPKHVSICQKFLKGDCVTENCLLSHNVTLEKMPTCRFFLQGCCLKTDCPYLHKKVSANEQICQEFLKGFCSLAAKCQKRHEYLCPEFESKGKCDKIKCQYIHKGQKAKRIKEPPIVPPIETAPPATRYYFEDDNEEMSEFRKMQLKRILGKVDAMKSSFTSEKDISEKIIELSDCDEDGSEAETTVVKKRPKLGLLPSFIPI